LSDKRQEPRVVLLFVAPVVDALPLLLLKKTRQADVREAPYPTSNATFIASTHDKGVKVALGSDHAGPKAAMQKDGVRLHLVCLDIEKLQHHSVQAVGGHGGRTNVGRLKNNKSAGARKKGAQELAPEVRCPRWQQLISPQSHKGSSEFPSSINSTTKSVRPVDKGASIKWRMAVYEKREQQSFNLLCRTTHLPEKILDMWVMS
jgi:hypothetical protein